VEHTLKATSELENHFANSYTDSKILDGGRFSSIFSSGRLAMILSEATVTRLKEFTDTHEMVGTSTMWSRAAGTLYSLSSSNYLFAPL
jgi:hypothetical protein